MTACGFRWSPWREIDGGMLERRCGCGAVERATFEAINTQALEQLDAMLSAWRRVFGAAATEPGAVRHE
jgi:hypothetical protein